MAAKFLLSQATEMVVRDDLPMELSLIDLDQQHVRDFPRPERIYQLSWPGLYKAFPLLETLPKKRSNLPEQATKLVGRKDELTDIEKLRVDPDKRLMTIIGPGGMGKTRFSVAAAEQQLAAAYFSDGVIFIGLAPLTGVDQIPAARWPTLSALPPGGWGPSSSAHKGNRYWTFCGIGNAAGDGQFRTLA